LVALLRVFSFISDGFGRRTKACGFFGHFARSIIPLSGLLIFDLWILLILLAGVLLPQLLALVTEEIGAKSESRADDSAQSSLWWRL